MFEALLTTILKRPYVFAFLASFLFLSQRFWGWKKTFLWLLLGYGIAWASEFSSIHNGFPYGLYHYLDSALVGELRIFGVPFFDSLSYTFLIFAGYSTACFAMRNIAESAATSFFTVFLGAVFTMLLDMIVDPLAHLGSYWFLGNIYYYEYPGNYFDVPVTNFLGWFLVAFVVMSSFKITEALADWRPCRGETASKASASAEPWRQGAVHPGNLLSNGPSHYWLYPAFFFSIILFNLAITAWIHAWALLACSSAITLLCTFLAFGKKSPK